MTANENPDDTRKRTATSVAQFAVDRFNNIHGTKFGAELIEQFTAYIVEKATDVDDSALKRHAANLGTMKLCSPEAWGKRKPWLSVPKGHRLLKALMGIVRDGDKAAAKL